MQGNRHLRFVIIGAGMSGILSGIKLKQAGFEQITILEKAGELGGTWRENTYPGLTCDVAAHAYTYSFEPNPDWSQYLASGGEIQEYFLRTAHKYGLDDLIQCAKEVVLCEYHRGSWLIRTRDGEALEADVVIAATGVLHAPRSPEIAGAKDFAGELFHSARWDHSVPLDGQRIGVIGSGSTGIQITSALSTRAATLVHFQRTAQWIMPIENRVFSEEQKQSFRDDPALLAHMQNEPNYAAAVDRFNHGIANPDSDAMHEIEAIVLQNLEQSVPPGELREKLRPNYRAACKRLVYSPDYYAAVQRPAVTVETTGIKHIEAAGARTVDGTLHELDIIVFATGFYAHQFMRPMEILGRNGASLASAWADGPSAYLSISMPEFPNFFMLNGPNGPVGNFSLIEIAEHQWHYVAQLIALLQSGEYDEVCVTQQALEDFDRERIAAAKNTIFGSGCDSWYLDRNGVPATWPWDRQRFFDAMRKPDLEAYDLRGGQST